MVYNPRMAADALTILLVEDDAAVARVLRRNLEGAGHRVLAACSAEEGLSALRAEKFDVVLLDNSLPGAMGITTLPEFVAASPAPVVMMTGHADEAVETDALLLGAKALLAKPFDLKDLQAVLEKFVPRP